MFTSYNVDSILSKLKDMITDECIQFVPLYKRRKSICPRWSNAEVKHTLNHVHTARSWMKRSSSRALVSKLESLEKMFETIVSTRAKYNLYTWSTLSLPTLPSCTLSDLSSSKSSPWLIIDKGLPIHDPGVITNIFNTSSYTLPKLKICLPPTHN